MSKITASLVLSGILVFTAMGAAHAVPTGVIYDAGYEGVITPDGGGPENDNYDWAISEAGSNRVRVETSNQWSAGT